MEDQMFEESECLNIIKESAFDLFLSAKRGLNTESAKQKLQLIQIQLNRLEQIETIRSVK